MNKISLKIIFLLVFITFFVTSCATKESDNVKISDVGAEENGSSETTSTDTSAEDTQSTDETGTETEVETDVGTDDEEIVAENKTQETAENETEDTEETDEDWGGIGVEVIEIKDLKFNPAEMTVSQGTMVRWIHNDQYANSKSIIHQIALYRKDGASNYVRGNRMMLGDSFNYTFKDTGEYYYIDIIFKDKMRGYITVE